MEKGKKEKCNMRLNEKEKKEKKGVKKEVGKRLWYQRE